MIGQLSDPQAWQMQTLALARKSIKAMENMNSGRLKFSDFDRVAIFHTCPNVHAEWLVEKLQSEGYKCEIREGVTMHRKKIFITLKQ